MWWIASLYDHARVVAALAAALWRYHADRGDPPEQARDAMRGYRDWDQAIIAAKGVR